MGKRYFKKTPSLSIARVKTSTVVILTANGKDSMIQSGPSWIGYGRWGEGLSKDFLLKGCPVKKRINWMDLFEVSCIGINK